MFHGLTLAGGIMVALGTGTLIAAVIGHVNKAMIPYNDFPPLTAGPVMIVTHRYEKSVTVGLDLRAEFDEVV
jgi:hypothetical protein